MTKSIRPLLVLLLAAVQLVGCSGQPSETEKPDTVQTTQTENPTKTTAPAEETATAPENDSAHKYAGEILPTKRVSVHDPSIVYEAESGKYYLFGSHRAWAVSDNLASWSTFSIGSLDNNYAALLESNAKWSAHGSKDYDISGNMWAPDVIYNRDMEKWCMYMSVNGENWYSSIAMLTSDSLTGPYEYAGTVVYSGFTTAEEAAETDFLTVTGEERVPARYRSGKVWNSRYGTNAIDPCVFYDKDGKLWMSYGSWFGGIYLLRLDNGTGLRDYDYTYETVKNESDSYFGYRISGGYGCTGEGSYIVWDEETGYYYLYLSYCGLNATDDFAGYHIRLFRSENVTGPYLDSMGHSAVCTKAGEDQSQKGVKLFGNYVFSSFAKNGETSSEGYLSPGHNSAFIDSDGQRYVIYHTRFNQGTERHEVRVHQQFMNEDGWPVTAVYEHRGSVISEDGYAVEEIVGEYEIINHGTGAATIKTGVTEPKKVTLNKDGTITGNLRGTWEKRVGADGRGYYVTMVIGSATYKGVFFRQYDESASHTERMTFTLIGDNDSSIWGTK